MMENKNYLLDTNIFHHIGLNKFIEENSNCGIIIPIFVLQELENQKDLDGTKGFKAREAIRQIYQIKKYGDLSNWIKLDNGISIKTESNYDDTLNLEFDKQDDYIIGCLSYCTKKYGKTILITNDIVMALKSESLGFENLQVDSKDDLYEKVYSGVVEIEVDDVVIKHFYERGYLYPSEIPLIPYQNQFVILKSKYNEKNKAIGIYCYDRLEKPLYFDYKPSGITPRNLEQKMAIELLMRDDIPVVSFTGKFGASKTFLQLAVALEKLNTQNYKKILLIKPPMPLDKNLSVGYKPGELFFKYLNTLSSVTSNLEALKEDKRDRFMNGVKILEGYVTQGLMEIVSIEDILGSSYNNCIIIAEEMQLLNKENMLAVLSRVGNARLFINGDLLQSSRLIHKDVREMGLFHFIETFKDSKNVAHLTLTSIQRSEFTKELSDKW